MALTLKANRRYPSVPVVTDDTKNHTQVLMAVKEALDTGQRRTGDIFNSFIRVQDLIDLGLITIEGNTQSIVGADLSEIANIGDLSSAATGDFLRFRSGEWVNDDLSTTDITQTMVTQHQAALSIAYSQLTGAPSIPSDLDDLSDVDLSTPPSTNDVLTFNGSSWVASPPSGGGGGGSLTLNDLLDVDAIYPNPGDVLTWDGYTWVNEAPSGGAGAENPLAVYEHFNDMDFQTPSSTTSGVHYLESTTSGNVAAVDGESGRIGIVRLRKQTATGGQANLYSAPLLVLGDGETTFECDVRLNLAQATNTEETGALLRIGFLDQTNGEPDNGVYFYCFPTVNSAQWALRTESGGATTTLNSSFAHVANAWFRLRFVVNADASEVEAFVNDVSFGTVTTNIPVGAALRTRLQIWQAAGHATGVMDMHVDWVRVRKELTASRV